jgi:uncharacterized protein (TIGR03083 family)
MANATRIDVWGAVRDERNALLADLERLRPEQWNAQSLCSEWTVRDVVAHLVGAVEASGAALMLALARRGFRLDRMLAEEAKRRSRDHTPHSLLTAFRGIIGSERHPPGTVATTMLCDTVLHSQDIRRPLGLRRAFPEDRIVAILDFMAPTNGAYGARRRIEGLHLHATDAAWAHGDGPEVAGPAEALMMAMAGRGAALDDLRGEGLALIRSRIPPG